MGELAALGAAVLWAAASLLFARAGRTTRPVALNFVKTLIGLVSFVATVAVLHGTVWPSTISADALGWLAFSGFVGLTIGDSAFFAALNRLGARRAMLSWALVPPTTALLAWPVLDEVFGIWAVLGVTITMLGIVWVLLERTPGASTESIAPGLAFAAVAVLCQSVGSVTAKMGGARLDAVTLTMVRLLFGTAGLFGQVVLTRTVGQVLALRWRDLVLVAGATMLGTYLGLWLSMASLQLTLAGISATLTATSPIFVLPFARIFEKEHVSPRAVAGAFVAVAGVAILLLR